MQGPDSWEGVNKLYKSMGVRRKITKWWVFRLFIYIRSFLYHIYNVYYYYCYFIIIMYIYICVLVKQIHIYIICYPPDVFNLCIHTSALNNYIDVLEGT